MLTDQHIHDVIERLTRRWEDCDVEAVLSHYTDDVDYIEAGAGLHIKGQDGLRRYLTKYFSAWDARWHFTKSSRLAGEDAGVVFWDMEIWRPGLRETRIVTKGMDLLLLRGDKVSRDQVYFDRKQLDPLLSPVAG